VKNPWDVLEIPEDCDAEVIKLAHRRLRSKHHPDKGGDKAAFNDVQEAFELLSDPEKRRRWEESGRNEGWQGPSPVELAKQAIAQEIEKLATGGQDLTYFDLKQKLHEARKVGFSQLKKQEELMKAQLERIALVEGKVKWKGSKPNFIAAHLRLKRMQLEQNLQQLTQSMKVGDEIERLLKEFDWEFTEQAVPQTGFTQQDLNEHWRHFTGRTF